MKPSKDIKSTIGLVSLRTDPFGDNVSAENAYRRGERIVGAIYLVTNHIQREEPLRTEIRSISHKLLRELLSLRDGFQSAAYERRGVILSDIRELLSLSQLLRIAGYVSEANVALLVQALDELGVFLTDSQYSPLSDGIRLRREDFIPSIRVASSTPVQTPPIDKHNTSTPALRAGAARVQTNPAVSPKKVGRVIQTEVHNERRDAIMDILAKSGPLGIRDITSQMVNCSEKTIQRELAVLIKDNIVRKEGEKRWSNYKLMPDRA